MNVNLLVVNFLITMSFAYGEFKLPLDVKTALAQSKIGENGGFLICGADDKVVKNYIKSNWKVIAENIECLPEVDPGEGYSITLDKDSSLAAVSNFAAACECLPPLEYLDFLDVFLDLYEKKQIPFGPVERNLMGVDQKSDFLSVNYSHPRVQAICEKAISLIPPGEVTLIEWVQSIKNGELADNYMQNRPDDDPGPETLPGIKLQRPWASLIKKFELRTGLKAPYDPKFDPRPARRGDLSAEQTAMIPQKQTVWPWLGGLLAMFVIAFSVWKLSARRSAGL